MVQLLMKDFRIQQRYIVLGFLFIGFFFFVLGAFEGMPLSVPAAIFSHFLIVVASKMDEKNNNGRMLASFPVTRRDIVSAKYLGVLMFMVVAFSLTILWRLVTAVILPENELPWFTLQSTMWTVAVLFIFYSLYFPMFFAFGAKIVQVLDLVAIFTIGGVTVLTLRILEWSQVDMRSFVSKVINQEGLWMWVAVGCAALFVLSWLMSILLYERKNI